MNPDVPESSNHSPAAVNIACMHHFEMFLLLKPIKTFVCAVVYVSKTAADVSFLAYIFQDL